MKSNVRIKVVENCVGTFWWIGLFEGKKQLMETEIAYSRRGNAIRAAKRIAKLIGIKYDPTPKKNGAH